MREGVRHEKPTCISQGLALPSNVLDEALRPLTWDRIA